MKWQNHLIIGASLGAVVNPLAIPAALAGSTAPDWLETLINLTGGHVRHRGITHILFGWICAMLFFKLVWDYHHLGLGFAIGGFSHVLADSFTVAGVPFSWWSDSRFHLFGGKLRTGNVGEYMVAIIVAFLCAGWLYVSHGNFANYLSNEKRDDAVLSGFIPFFYNWQKAYNDGVVDAKEWKENRMRFL